VCVSASPIFSLQGQDMPRVSSKQKPVATQPSLISTYKLTLFLPNTHCSAAILPAAILQYVWGDRATYKFLLIAQVALALQLPVTLVPMIKVQEVTLVLLV